MRARFPTTPPQRTECDKNIHTSSTTTMTRVLRVDPKSISFVGDIVSCSDAASLAALQDAAKLIAANQVVAFPTETVYGLGGSALSDDAVHAIYTAKNRPADNPLIVHVLSIDQLKRRLLPPSYTLPEAYTSLCARFWPGPLTILLPVHPNLPLLSLVTAGQLTFAVRIPLHPVARALIALSDTPVAAPLANASTRPSPTLAAHVVADLGDRIPVVVDGGACAIGVESTVVDGLSSPPMLLRPGGVLPEEVVAAGGAAWKDMQIGKATAGADEKVRTPGMKYKHYLPTSPVVLFHGGTEADVVLWLKGRKYRNIAVLSSVHWKEISLPNVTISTLPLGTSSTEMSHNLFRALREADGVEAILVEGVADAGHGLAVMNRLRKAATELVTF